jgi:hypothetical protein
VADSHAKSAHFGPVAGAMPGIRVVGLPRTA